MTYDGTDPDDDGTVEADVDNESVSTGDLDTGRSWQEVTLSRSFDTTETNTTDSEIWVAATAEATADATSIGLRWEGDVQNGSARPDRFRQTVDTGEVATIQVIVPVGDTYKAATFDDTADFDLKSWTEFKQ